MLRIILIAACSIFFYSTSAFSASIAGIEFPDSIEDGGNTLQLNGLGIRKKFVIKVYAAGLYLPELTDQVETILSTDQPSQVRMHFLYKEVSKEKLLGSLEDGFAKNLSEGELSKLENEIQQLRDLFKTVYKGDEVILNYVPEQGTEIFFNNESQGIISGFSFHQAIMSVWLGEKPADKKLKKGMLGKNKS
jgi:hypothetical protein